MTNAEILAKVILDIAEHLQPRHQQYPVRALEKILTIMNEAKAVEVAERVQAGYTGPQLVK